jgi:hypothetical protein
VRPDNVVETLAVVTPDGAVALLLEFTTRRSCAVARAPHVVEAAVAGASIRRTEEQVLTQGHTSEVAAAARLPGRIREDALDVRAQEDPARAEHFAGVSIEPRSFVLRLLNLVQESCLGAGVLDVLLCKPVPLPWRTAPR